MRKSTVLPLALLVALSSTGSATAGSRSIRVEFGDWSSAQAIGSAACPGTTTGSQQIAWNGYILTGSDDPSYLFDAYCQTAIAGEFDQDSFNGEDSPYVGRLVGLNSDNRVTAIRYTFLDSDRFSTSKQGYQWVIYSFPGAKLIGFNSSAGFALTATSRITQEGDDSNVYWSADQYSDGEYLCFVQAGSGAFSDRYILSDESWEFSAESDFSPLSQNRCVSRLTGSYTDSFENP